MRQQAAVREGLRTEDRGSALSTQHSALKPARFALVPFRARHVAEIAPEAAPEMLELAAIAEQHGTGYTAFLSGRPVASAGVLMQRAGMAEAWALFSPASKRYPVQLFRSVKKGLEEIIRTELKGLRTEDRGSALSTQHSLRLYAVVDPADAAAARFMEHLGFQLSRHLYELSVRQLSAVSAIRR